MNINWNTILNVVIGLIIFTLLDKLVLNKVWEKIGVGDYEVIADE